MPSAAVTISSFICSLRVPSRTTCRGHNDRCPSKYRFRSSSRAFIANLAESWKLFVTSGMGRDVARKLTPHCPWRSKSSDKSRSLQESATGHSSSASTTMKFLELCSITAASTFVSSLTDGRALLPLYRPYARLWGRLKSCSSVAEGSYKDFKLLTTDNSLLCRLYKSFTTSGSAGNA
ncbi:hypothetical protein ASPSYDRAFT_496935 [Aspergillus sydowii CBS 593.65]|uniref:Uncharacterized protein n=1 Tax=Aspergillus sydowii CBS 593.65 TaxID=1036612 RepID=A0A1L9T4C5_9EURO|nr:uncharacterized protein ASPSYDRAFT_496935 [Aspergillus sydowii CBS 593.65]OJJ54277.1 hypothetical protein ASPSYDRAFT_496935 [Aspergillus sydowii CBS 593.65]